EVVPNAQVEPTPHATQYTLSRFVSRKLQAEGFHQAVNLGFLSEKFETEFLGDRKKLKPFGIEDLQQALERYEQKVNRQNTPAQFEMLINQIKGINKETPKSIAVPTQNGLTFIKVDEIVRCESDNNYTTFYLTNKSKIVVSRSLKEYEEMLEECNFFRIHAKHLINMSRIKNYTRGEGGIVTMDDGSELDVARRRKDEFLLKIASR
ncbi:MAG: LytTR family transcriptional regulator DNA-binding domain-containing protein, partial [Bacteroidota bacterium]